jgi:hypothetical protein
MSARMKWMATLAAVLVAVAAWFVVDALHESCGEWQARLSDARLRSMQFVPGYDTSREELVYVAVMAQRPEGC